MPNAQLKVLIVYKPALWKRFLGFRQSLKIGRCLINMPSQSSVPVTEVFLKGIGFIKITKCAYLVESKTCSCEYKLEGLVSAKDYKEVDFLWSRLVDWPKSLEEAGQMDTLDQ